MSKYEYHLQKEGTIIDKVRPYDEATYYKAYKHPSGGWYILNRATLHVYRSVDQLKNRTIEQVVKELDAINKTISSRISYN